MLRRSHVDGKQHVSRGVDLQHSNIMLLVAADEFRHYKLFYAHLRRCLQRDRLSRWARLRIGWNESGLWHPQAATGVDAAEVEAMEDELYFRLRGIQRAVLMRAGELPAEEAAVLAALCESLPMGRMV